MTTGPATLRFQFDGEVWFYTNPNAVYFVSLPREMSEEILEVSEQSLHPWGTVPVQATIGAWTWASSMFPRKDRRYYDLPLNATVRRRVRLQAGTSIPVTIDIPLPM